MACGHCRRPRQNKRTTQNSLTLRNPAGLLVRSPGKPGHTTFLTVAGIPRRFSSVPPENRVTQLSSPWLHTAALLVRSGLSTPGPRRRVFSRILRFEPRPGNQAGNEAGNQARLSPLIDSAPSLYTMFGTWLHSAALLVRSGLSTPGPRRRVFSRILRFAPRPGNQAGNQAGNQTRLSPLIDSAPSLYTMFGTI